MNIPHETINGQNESCLAHDLVEMEVHNDGVLKPKQLYARGYQAWQAGNYAAALIDFTWLALHHPYERRFHLAMAGALQMEGEYIPALAAYGCALALDICDPEPIYQMAVCLQALGKEADAREALQMAVKMSYIDPVFNATRKKANQLLAKI